MKYLIYCTMAKPYLVSNWTRDHEEYFPQRVNFLCDKKQALQSDLILNGKIVAEFECDRVEEIKYKIGYPFPYLDFESELPKACLSNEELEEYLFPNNGYAIHIKNLKVFDRPLELNEVDKIHSENEISVCVGLLKKAPQNMIWVWYEGEKYCLISIRSEWVCKILNGEKTIEVRKKVLKGCL